MADLVRSTEPALASESRPLERSPSAPHSSLSPDTARALRHQLLFEWNDTASQIDLHGGLHRLFEAQAERYPDALALATARSSATVGDTQARPILAPCMSYGELNARANQLARHLRALGTREESRIGLFLRRGPDLVVTVLGILKAGAAYLPLIPGDPSRRIATVLREANLDLLLTSADLEGELPAIQEGPMVLLIDRQWPKIAHRSRTDLPNTTGPSHLAYVLFTSGSTGRPKGVLVPHGGLINYLKWALRQYDVKSGRGAPLHSSLAFDLTVTSLFAPLLAGRCLTLLPEGSGLEDLQEALEQPKGFSFVKLTPTHLEALQSMHQVAPSSGGRKPGRFGALVLGGEPLHTRSLSFWRGFDPGTAIYNEYGPTETVVGCTYHQARSAAGDETVPIGRPIDNTQIYILGRDGHPVAPGEVGELHVGGLGVARGYLGQPAMSATRFVPDPFATTPGSRLYQTGDLARFLPDGRITFLGRADHQVKIHGYRIEPGEIEVLLRKHPSVATAAIAAREDIPGSTRLFAYVVRASRPRAESSAPKDAIAGTPRALDQEHLVMWQSLFEDLYSRHPADPSSQLQLAFQTADWEVPMDERAPEEEMHGWIRQTVDRILALRPNRVLEIGCGTGLLTFRLAPYCSAYLGTDFSYVALERLKSYLAAPDYRLPQITLRHQSADCLEGIEPGGYDTVVLASVVQYFPSIEYLVQVLKHAATVAPGGSVFLGDVRNLELLQAFYATAELRLADPAMSITEIQERTARHQLLETELLIAPELFARLRHDIPSIRRIRILPKDGDGRNELRYDVILELGRRIGDAGTQPIPIEPLVNGTWLDWRKDKLNLATLREALETMPDPGWVGVRRIPDRRLSRGIKLASLLDAPPAELRTVADLDKALRGAELEGVELDDVRAVARRAGARLEWCWQGFGLGGTYSAVFRRPGTAVPSGVFGEASERPLQALANDPLRNQADRHLGPILKRYLEQRLPRYMVPVAFVFLESLPQTASGKTDRSALPTPSASRLEPKRSYVAPRTPVEETLARIWAEVLRLERVGVHDNLFELGGDSILNIQIAAKANQVGLRLTPKDIFDHPTIAELAAFPGKRAAQVKPLPARQELVTGPVPLTPIQRWFFFENDLPEPWHHNRAHLLVLLQPIEPSMLARAVLHLLEHHDALRLRFEPLRTSWRQSSSGLEDPLPFTSADLSRLDTNVHRKAITRASTQVQGSLRLGSGPLLRVVHFDLGVQPLEHPEAGHAQPGRLLLVIHQLAADTASWPILLADLESAYWQIEAGAEVTLLPKTTSFQEWAVRSMAFARSTAARRDLRYWLSQPAAVPGLPQDNSAAGAPRLVPERTAETVVASLEPAETRLLLRQVPSAYRTQIADVLLTALVRAFARWTGNPTLWLDLQGYGREQIIEGADLSRTVGWLSAPFPILLDLCSAQGDGESIKAIKEQLRGVPQGGIGYSLLSYLSADPSIMDRLRALPRREVCFAYAGQFDAWLAGSSLFEPAPESPGPVRSRLGERPYALEIESHVAGDRLCVAWTFHRDRHRRSTIEHLADEHMSCLRGLIAHCLSPQAGGCTPSDYPLAGLDPEALDQWVGKDRSVEDIYPLSPMQQGMLFHALYSPESTAYFMQLSWSLQGDLDPEAFHDAWQRLLERHSILRTCFAWQGLENPLQIVRRQVTLPWQLDDWRALDADAQERQLERYLAEDRQRGFTLTVAPLVRVSLIRLGEHAWRFTWSVHHLLLDGWSISLLFEELFTYYRGVTSQWPVEIERPRPYRDFVAWLAEQDTAAAESFWRRQLAGFSTPTTLLNQDSHEVSQATTGAARRDAGHRLSSKATAALQDLARHHRLTLNTVVQGAWAILLARLSGQRDVVFGATSSGRPESLSGADGMIGLLINSLPVRVRISPREPILSWLHHLQNRNVEIRQFQSSALVDIQSWSAIPNHLPLFESLLGFQNYPLESSRQGAKGKLDLDDLRFFSQTDYPLVIEAVPGDRLWFRASYAASIGDLTVHRILDELSRLLDGLASAPHQPLGALLSLTPVERHQMLYEWNDTAPPRKAAEQVPATLPERLEAVARALPDRVAMLLEGRHLSYGELWRRGLRLALELHEHGVCRGELVGLSAERSPEMLVGLVGILTAGGAYVPLDPDYPRERLEWMLEDTGIRILVAQPRLRDRLPTEGLEVISLLPGTAEHVPAATTVRPRIQAEDLAYVLYTSGSTGRPKGVAVSHGAILRLIDEHGYGDLEMDAAGDLVASQTAPLAFDASTFELWWTLSVGARLAPLPPGPIDLYALARHLQVERVTTAWLTIGLFHQMVDTHANVVASIRRVLTGGDILSVPHIERVLDQQARIPGAIQNRLVACYGPTENTVFSSCIPLQPGSKIASTVPIGRPVAGTQIHLVDRGLLPTALGVAGELVTGGRGLARGYHARPALTAERFVPDPFADVPGQRLYMTGDRARWLPDGMLEFLGRVDFQVKIRGFRIELGEIEAQLRKHPAVRDVVVAARAAPAPSRENGSPRAAAPRDRRLVAYVIHDPQHTADDQPATEWENEHISHWRTLYEAIYQRIPPDADVTVDTTGWNSSYNGQPIPEAEMREWIEQTAERVLGLLGIKPAALDRHRGAKHRDNRHRGNKYRHAPGTSASGLRVLEIGCGTGLILSRLAPYCERYVATDFSGAALERLDQHLARLPAERQLPHVELQHRSTNDFSATEPASFDVVMLNTVVQFLPSASYLVDVLRGAIEAVAAGGSIFIGDVRSLPLLDAFCASLELDAAPDSLPLNELRERASRRRLREDQLVVDPAFFLALQQELPRIQHVQILPKGGRARNEITLFRYDVVLHIAPDASSASRRRQAGLEPKAASSPSPPMPSSRPSPQPQPSRQPARSQEPGQIRESHPTEAVWLDWEREKLTLTSIRHYLEKMAPAALGILRVPDPRLSREVRLVELLESPKAPQLGRPNPSPLRTAADLRQALRVLPHEGLEPEDLRDLCRDAGYSLEISRSAFSTNAVYGALFRRIDSGHPAKSATPAARDSGSPWVRATRPWKTYATNPLRNRIAHRLSGQLREHLRDYLPDHMLPSSFVLLDDLPQTPSGKIDRRALPAPDDLHGKPEEAFMAPRTLTEKTLAEVWAEVLGLERIGLHDDFFELGGHSLLATQVTSRLQERLHLEVPVRSLFDHPSIFELAQFLDQQDPPASSTPETDLSDFEEGDI